MLGVLRWEVLLTLVAASKAVGTCSSTDAASCASKSQAGIALVQWSRKVRTVDTGAGLLEPNVSMSQAVNQAVTDGLLIAQVPALVPPVAGQLASPHVPTVAEAKIAEALVTEHEAPSLPALSGHAASPHSNDLSGSSTADNADTLGAEIDNSSLPPITQERFEPFGYPGAGLLLEMHLPKVTLRELHSSSHGSLAQFLLEVREQLCSGAKVPSARISILGIHGRYKRYDNQGLFHVRSEHQGHSGGPFHFDEEVVVRFEILPGFADDPDPKQVLSILELGLGKSDSSLMTGPLSTVLVNASITSSSPLGVITEPRMVEHRGMAHMSAMAWPIGISAAFIGILIWLAAY